MALSAQKGYSMPWIWRG